MQINKIIMKTFQTLALSFIAVLFLGLASCKYDATEPTPTPVNPYEDLVYIGETQAVGADAIVKLYAEAELFMGYNRLHVVVLDAANTSKFITDAQVTFNPMMDMGAMQHSCPFENPGMMVEEGTNAFTGYVIFIMPTTATGSWNLGINVLNNENGKEGLASFDITVIENAEPKLFSFQSDFDGSMLFVALIDPMNPEIGINKFNLGIYQRETMMSFPGVEDIIVKSEPWMPSMNHGSPNNVDPISVGEGKYEGAVNFTMSGYWQIKLDFETENQEVIKTGKYFDITFQ